MPHYTASNPLHIGTTVFLDGIQIRDVTECDTDEGWVVKAKRNDEGRLYAVGDDLAVEKLFGTVTVERPDVQE